jgi:hypothetical protein
MNKSAKKTNNIKRGDVTVGLNSHEFQKAIIATCADILAGRISPAEGRAINAEHRKILKAFELQAKFGSVVARRIERGEL